jgi:hypothetical protein
MGRWWLGVAAAVALAGCGTETGAPGGVAGVAPETVVMDGRSYQVRFLPEGGAVYTARPTGGRDANGDPEVEEGVWRLDSFRVAGTDDGMEAVAVYLRFCRGINEVDPVWANEGVRRDPATGEWSFEYPDDCAVWRARGA